MDREDLSSVLRTTGVDLWTLIDTAIAVAVADHGSELKVRRGGIVERLFTPPPAQPDRCPNCGSDGRPIGVFGEKEREEAKGSSSPIAKPAAGSPSPPTPQSNQREETEEEEEEEGDGRRSYGRSIDSEKKNVLAIKEFLEDPGQTEDSIVSLLQNLADMDITFKTLKETDIGRHVNGLRKHPSTEVRRLVKQLVRKWKEIVDEWVKSNSACETASPAIITDGDSPQQIALKSNQSGHQVPDFAYSPNPHNGHLSADRNSLEPVETKAKAAQRREAPQKPTNSTLSSATPVKVKEQKDSLLDPERLASARKRLHENYQEAQNAKKQRTIQVMDIHEIPKPKNSFVARNKGGFHAKHW